jgi:hypothetical protein
MLWRLADIFFVIFHSTLILFNLFGWIWKKTRRINLITLLLTAFSWLFLGLFVGSLGYCPLTDWHFSVLKKLGNTNLSDSYIKYLAERLTGISFDSRLVDNVTLYAFIFALALSLFVNIRSSIRRKR